MIEKRIYPYKVDTVFEFLKDVCNRPSFTVKNIDESIRRITISTQPSLFSYGENLEVIAQPENHNKTLVYIKSEPKAFFNITARSVAKRNIQNIYIMLEKALHEDAQG